MPPSPVVSDKALATLRSYAEKGGRLVLLPPFNTLDANLRPKGAAACAPGWKGDVTLVGDFSGRYDAHPHEPADYASKFDDAFVLNKGGAGEGALCGPDFSGAKLVDSLTGEEVEPHFALPAFGYRVLEILPM